MSDVGIFIIDGCFQLNFENGDYARDETLETAVIISLFSDQRATETEASEYGDVNKRGWWADMFPSVEGDEIGSKIWLLGRSKVSNENLVAHETYAKNALNWMLDDGVAKEISAVATYDENLRMQLEITITRPDGNEDKFGVVWDEQQVKRIG